MTRKTVSIRNVDEEDWNAILKFCKDADISLCDLVAIVSRSVERAKEKNDVNRMLEFVNENKLSDIEKILFR